MDKTIIKFIKLMLSNTKSRAKVYGGITKEFNLTAGVRQGGIVSPLLFNTFINDVKFI